MEFLIFSQKVNFEKGSADNKKHAKLPSMKSVELIPVVNSGISSSLTNLCLGKASPSHREKYCVLCFFKPGEQNMNQNMRERNLRVYKQINCLKEFYTCQFIEKMACIA